MTIEDVAKKANLLAQTEKKEKSPAKPRWKFKRGVICGRFPSDFRQNPVCYLR
jgi:hypothetical protein